MNIKIEPIDDEFNWEEHEQTEKSFEVPIVQNENIQNFENPEQFEVKVEYDDEINPRLNVKLEEHECLYTSRTSSPKIGSTEDDCPKTDVLQNNSQFNEIDIQYEPIIKKSIQKLPNHIVNSNFYTQSDDTAVNTIPNEVLPSCSRDGVFFAEKHDKTVLNNDTNSDDKLFKCSQCQYRCRTLGILNKHVYVHSDEKPFKCDMCQYVCKRPGRLKQHKLIHSDEKPFQCDVCDYKSNQSSHLKSHKLTHTDIKPFECDVCSFRCRQYCNLQTHKLVHTDEKVYKCDMCTYECRLLGSLKSHKIIHTNEKSYKCDQCDNAYKRLRNLKIHKTIHSGENMLKCEHCDFTCRLLRNLKSHRTTHQTNKIK